MIERLNSTLQVNILTLLAYDINHGRVIVNTVNIDLFEGDYRTIAERIVDYWNRYDTAPGDHTPDLVADITEDSKNKRQQTYRRIVLALREISTSVNVKYVMDQLNAFTRMQRLKAAILKSAEALNAQQEEAILTVEDIWHDLLHDIREVNDDKGMKLTEINRVMKYLESNESEFITGIKELDNRNVCPAREKVWLFLAPAGRGKSWALINIARQNLMLRKKILFISLEMSEEELAQRFYQNMFSVPTRASDIQLRTMEFDSLNHLQGLDIKKVNPDFSLDSGVVREELETRLVTYGARYENLIIKRFPPRTVSIKDIEGWIDNLELVDRFIPDMLIIDYIGRIKTTLKEHRLTLGVEFENFRGMCIRRNIAGVTAHQVSRTGAQASTVRGTHVSEDYSFLMTADNVITYSCTDAEHELGLARLYVEKARTERDHFGLLITQNYGIGQFCLQSTLLTSKYHDLLKDLEGDSEDEEPEED